MCNKPDYAEVGLFCAKVCEALDQGLKGRKSGEFSQSILRAIGRLTTSVELIACELEKRTCRCLARRSMAEIQRKVVKLGSDVRSLASYT